jgi:hypothetical protein
MEGGGPRGAKGRATLAEATRAFAPQPQPPRLLPRSNSSSSHDAFRTTDAPHSRRLRLPSHLAGERYDAFDAAAADTLAARAEAARPGSGPAARAAFVRLLLEGRRPGGGGPPSEGQCRRAVDAYLSVLAEAYGPSLVLQPHFVPLAALDAYQPAGELGVAARLHAFRMAQRRFIVYTLPEGAQPVPPGADGDDEDETAAGQPAAGSSGGGGPAAGAAASGGPGKDGGGGGNDGAAAAAAGGWARAFGGMWDTLMQELRGGPKDAAAGGRLYGDVKASLDARATSCNLMDATWERGQLVKQHAAGAGGYAAAPAAAAASRARSQLPPPAATAAPAAD